MAPFKTILRSRVGSSEQSLSTRLVSYLCAAYGRAALCSGYRIKRGALWGREGFHEPRAFCSICWCYAAKGKLSPKCYCMWLKVLLNSSITLYKLLLSTSWSLFERCANYSVCFLRLLVRMKWDGIEKVFGMLPTRYWALSDFTQVQTPSVIKRIFFLGPKKTHSKYKTRVLCIFFFTFKQTWLWHTESHKAVRQRGPWENFPKGHHQKQADLILKAQVMSG